MNLYIPKNILVGFNARSDTFSGRLAFITYRDEKNVVKQEKAWENWRDKSMAVQEYENVPSNYVLNKGVTRHGYWGNGRSVIRVFDNRNFEIEIGVDNLMGILMHSDVSKRDIMEPCVYAWAGRSLVLLPINSIEYQQALAYTEKQASDIDVSSVKEGMTLAAKKDAKPYIYLGHRNWYTSNCRISEYLFKSKGKCHIFYDGTDFVVKEWKAFSHIVDATTHPNTNELIDKFLNTKKGQAIVGLKVKPARISKKNKEPWVPLYKEKNGKLLEVSTVNGRDKGTLDFYDYRFLTTRFSKKSELQSIFFGATPREDFVTLPKSLKKEHMVKLFEEYGVGELVYVLKNGTEVYSD